MEHRPRGDDVARHQPARLAHEQRPGGQVPRDSGRPRRTRRPARRPPTRGRRRPSRRAGCRARWAGSSPARRPVRGAPRRRTRTRSRSAPTPARRPRTRRSARRPAAHRRRASAVNVSPRVGMCTTPTSVPSSSSQATLTAHVGQPEQVVHGAVERIHHPADARAAGDARPLLAQQAVVGPGREQPAADQRLGVAVGIGDQVGRGALRVDAGRRPPEALQQQPPRPPWRQTRRGRAGRRHRSRAPVSHRPSRTAAAGPELAWWPSGEHPANGLVFSADWMHPDRVHRLIDRLRGRRRDRTLARELERRARAQLDARAEAAARMADDVRRGSA